MVQALAAAGYGHDAIAAYLGVTAAAVRRRFRRELDFAQAELLAGAARALGRMAVGAPAAFDEQGRKIQDEVKPDLRAICFLLKTRGKALGWSERAAAPLPAGLSPTTLDPDLLKGMSDDELAILERALGHLRSGDRDGAGGAAGAADEDAYARALDADEGDVAA